MPIAAPAPWTTGDYDTPFDTDDHVQVRSGSDVVVTAAWGDCDVIIRDPACSSFDSVDKAILSPRGTLINHSAYPLEDSLSCGLKLLCREPYITHCRMVSSAIRLSLRSGGASSLRASVAERAPCGRPPRALAPTAP
jgi:hypothetical protein